MDRQVEAVAGLVETPAVDWVALARKIEIHALDNYRGEPAVIEDALLASIYADVQRLSGRRWLWIACGGSNATDRAAVQGARDAPIIPGDQP